MGSDKLLIHYFQESLTRSITRWYMKPKGNQIQSWKDLLKSFLSQYDHEVDTAPDRMSLMTKEKKETKSFKEYTQR